MKQLTYIKTRSLQWEDVSEPKIASDNEALVRPFLVARCDLDAAFLQNNLYRRYMAGKFLGLVDNTIEDYMRMPFLKGPFPIGHECIAEIVELGKNVKGFSVGQYVIIPFQISCGECPICMSGLTSQCEETDDFDMYSGIGKHISNGGAMSDLLKVPFAQKMLVPIPEGLDLEGLASASDNLPDAWSRVAPHLLNQPGKKVLIIGGAAKSIGLYAAGFAAKMQVDQLDYIDLSDERVDIANKLGANGIRTSHSDHEGQYDLIVNASSSKKVFELGIQWLRPGGVFSSANVYFDKKIGVPFFQLYAKNLTIKTGLANSMADIPNMLTFIKDNNMKPEIVTTYVGHWDDAEKGLLKNTTKVIIKRNPISSGC